MQNFSVGAGGGVRPERGCLASPVFTSTLPLLGGREEKFWEAKHNSLQNLKVQLCL